MIAVCTYCLVLTTKMFGKTSDTKVNVEYNYTRRRRKGRGGEKEQKEVEKEEQINPEQYG